MKKLFILTLLCAICYPAFRMSVQAQAVSRTELRATNNILLAIIRASQTGSVSLSNLMQMGITNIVASTNMHISTNNGVLYLASTASGGSGDAGGTNARMFAYNGYGTNIFTYGDVDAGAAAYAPLNVFPVSNNISSAGINLISRGTNGAAIIHSRNLSSGLSGDFGLWGPTFGPPYRATWGISLYDNDLPTTNHGPQFAIFMEGKWPGDSGMVARPIVLVSPTNRNFQLMRSIADSRVGKAGFHFDMQQGVLGLYTHSTNSHYMTGVVASVTAGTPATLTGTGTKWLDECPPGTLVFNSNNVAGLVVQTDSDTSMKVMSLSGGDYGTGTGTSGQLQVQKPSFHSDGLNTDLQGVATTAAGQLFVAGGFSGTQILMSSPNRKVVSWWNTDSGLNLHNYENNSDPFSISTGGVATVTGITLTGRRDILGDANMQSLFSTGVVASLGASSTHRHYDRDGLGGYFDWYRDGGIISLWDGAAGGRLMNVNPTNQTFTPQNPADARFGSVAFPWNITGSNSYFLGTTYMDNLNVGVFIATNTVFIASTNTAVSQVTNFVADFLYSEQIVTVAAAVNFSHATNLWLGRTNAFLNIALMNFSGSDQTLSIPAAWKESLNFPTIITQATILQLSLKNYGGTSQSNIMAGAAQF